MSLKKNLCCALSRNFSRSFIVLCCAILFWTLPTQAQTRLASYKWEFGGTAGLNLPYDLWGTPGTLSTLGVFGAMKVNDKGSISLGAILQHADPDRAYTAEALFRYELSSASVNAIFMAGLHYSYFSLDLDYDETGSCVPANCLTDSGSHTGIVVGGGLQIPLGNYTPFRLAMKFYQSPQIWLLLEAGIGFRY